MKRDHEQQEGSRRKVLRLDEGQDGECSSASDTEEAGRAKKKKEESGKNMDIQVNSGQNSVMGTSKTGHLSRCSTPFKLISLFTLASDFTS